MDDRKIRLNFLNFGADSTEILWFECFLAYPAIWTGTMEISSKLKAYTEEGRFDVDKASPFVQTFAEGVTTTGEGGEEAYSAVIARANQLPGDLLPESIVHLDPVLTCLSFGQLYGHEAYCCYDGKNYSDSWEYPSELADIRQKAELVVVGEESLDNIAELANYGNKLILPRAQVQLAKQAVFAGAFTFLASQALNMGPREVADFAPLVCNLEQDVHQYRLNAAPEPLQVSPTVRSRPRAEKQLEHPMLFDPSFATR